MDCQDVRLLLALERRSGDSLDPTERAALQQHLDACPDCTALARSEQAIDAALSSAMRAVAVPASARLRILVRLRATAPKRWPRVTAAAAAVLLLTLGLVGTVWYVRQPTVVLAGDVIDVINERPVDPRAVEDWYRRHGIEMVASGQFKYEHLWTCDIVDFKGRRVPKLIFFNSGDAAANERDRAAIAEVIVLRTSLFDTRDLNHSFDGQTPNHIEVQEIHTDGGMDYVYLIGTNQTSLDAFMNKSN